MCSIFNLWYEYDRDRVSIGYFDSLLEKTVTGRANVCSLADNCCNYFVVEQNGDVYPCDFFVDPFTMLGNINHDSWD